MKMRGYATVVRDPSRLSILFQYARISADIELFCQIEVRGRQ